VPAAAYEVLENTVVGCWVEPGEAARSKRRSVEVEETSPDDVVGGWDGAGAVDSKNGLDAEECCCCCSRR